MGSERVGMEGRRSEERMERGRGRRGARHEDLNRQSIAVRQTILQGKTGIDKRN